MDWSSGCGEAGSYDEGGQVHGEDNNLVFLKKGRNCVIKNFTAESRSVPPGEYIPDSITGMRCL